METKFNFNSQICTSRVQSERLLALGLREETADMHWYEYDIDSYKLCVDSWTDIEYFPNYKSSCIPAWSLNRIRELLKKSQVTLSFFEDGDYVVVERYGVFQNILDQRVDMWDNLCDAFLYLITEGYFNKDYLINQDVINK